MIPSGMRSKIEKVKEAFEKAPEGLKRGTLALILLVGYVLWCVHRTPPPAPGKPVVLPPAVSVAKVAAPATKVPVRIVPKAAVRKALPAMAEDLAEDDEDGEHVADTGKVPEAPNGGEVVVKIDTKTGETKTEFQANPSPWFALRADNALGVGVQASTAGSSIPLYYRRTIAQVKSVFLVGEAGGRVPVSVGMKADKAELHGAVFLEGRWQ